MYIRERLPSPEETAAGEGEKTLLICDRNTEAIARKLRGKGALCVLPPGEGAKNWESAEAALRAAGEAGLGRGGLFVGVGGGVVCDLAAFAASVYMRGAALALVPTSLLGMADAALGGKTGFDLFGIKNLAGTFYPASRIYICRESLASLPEGQWKSGMAEIIKTAIIEGGDGFFGLLESLGGNCQGGALMECVARSLGVKGRIVEADPRETGEERALLNLGHTFGHALESALGLGLEKITHGEAVAWGTVRAAELGRVLGITPPERERKIRELFRGFGYEIRAPHPLLEDRSAFIRALGADKKKREGKARFIVPSEKGAVPAAVPGGREAIIEGIVRGDYW